MKRKQAAAKALEKFGVTAPLTEADHEMLSAEDLSRYLAAIAEYRAVITGVFWSCVVIMFALWALLHADMAKRKLALGGF